MKPNHKRTAAPERTLNLWTHEQARNALPYIHSVMQSIRERYLNAVQEDVKARKLAAKPGRPGRAAILEQEAATKEARLANERLQDTLQEFFAIDVYCLDPVNGLALIPFMQENQLAWFVYDMFDEQPLRAWRYHSDSLETRRPLVQISEGPAPNALVV